MSDKPDLDTGQMSSDDLAALIESVNAGGGQEPGPGPKQATDYDFDLDPDETGTETRPAETRTPPQQDPVYTIKVRGEDKTLPLSKIIDFAQMGVDYNLKSSEVNKVKAELDRREAELRERETALDNAGPAGYGYHPGQAPTHPDYSGGQAPPEGDRFRDLMDRDPYSAVSNAAAATVHPHLSHLQNQVADLTLRQDPMFPQVQADYLQNRRRGMGPDEALTRAKVTFYEKDYQARTTAGEAEAKAKENAARSATVPTGTAGGPAGPARGRLTDDDIAKMSSAQLETVLRKAGVMKDQV